VKIYTTSEHAVVVDVSAGGVRAYVQLETPTGIVAFDDAAAEQLEYAIRAARIGAQAINIGSVRVGVDPPGTKKRAWLGGPLIHQCEAGPDRCCLQCGQRL
jgi:hypothetical protein